MQGEMHHVALWLGGAMLVLGGLYYFFVHRHMARKTEGGKPEGGIAILPCRVYVSIQGSEHFW